MQKQWTVLSGVFSCFFLLLGQCGYAEEPKISDKLPAKAPVFEKAIASSVKFMLGRRCEHYGASVGQKRECKAIAAELMDALNLRGVTIPKDPQDPDAPNFAGAAFPMETIEILKEAAIQEYIHSLSKLAREHSGDPINLWDWTLAHAGGDEIEALRRVAILFQDIDAFTYTKFLTAIYDDGRYNGLIDEIREIGFALKSDAKVVFKALPQQASADKIQQSKALYHFYVIAYLAYKLQAAHPRSAMAKAAPFILNTTYEYFRHRLIPGLDRVPDPMSKKDRAAIKFFDIPLTMLQFVRPTDPKSISLGRNPTNPGLYSNADAEYRDVLEDSYMGYAGAIFGASLIGNSRSYGLEYDEFAKAFAANPKEFIQDAFFQ